MKLTNMETRILNAMRENKFEDCLDEWDFGHATWTFAVIDNSKIDAKQARGVISSLVKKELVYVVKDPENDMIGFTDKGAKLFDNATGDKCSWGGKRLIKIPIE